MSKIFENYQNPGYSLSFKEVKDRIEELTTELRGSESYYRRRQLAVLTKEQREDILLENEIQDEIDFYEAQIHGFRDNEEDEEDEEEEPYYHINDYCDPYLGRESPPIPMSESDEVEEPETKIDSLEKKLGGVEDVVYQLLGGLFNQRTQSDILDSHLCSLRGTRYLGSGVNEDSIWPTTRQGDKHEEEIKLLKEQVSRLEDTLALLIRVIKDQGL